jgi:hypothetical protein
MSKTTTALVPASNGGIADYQLATVDPESMRELVEVNLGGNLSPRDLTTVHVPSGVASSFDVPTLEGPQSVKELTGVLLRVGTSRALFSRSFQESGGKDRPECYSEDGLNGHGTPGGDCANCPMNVFGSALKGYGKSCIEKKLLFLATKDSLLPMVVVASPGSHKGLQVYLRQLTAGGKLLSSVVTGISLTAAQSADGIKYSQLVFRMLYPLSSEDGLIMRSVANAMKGALGKFSDLQEPEPSAD